MTIESKPFVLFKNIPSERYSPYKDPHRPLHARNIEVIKKRHKVEQRLIAKANREDLRLEIARERKVEKEAAAHWRLLNVI